jgi:hypothetical protein
MMSFQVSKWSLDLINTQMANCIWNDFEGYIKLHLATGNSFSKNRSFVGLVS